MRSREFWFFIESLLFWLFLLAVCSIVFVSGGVVLDQKFEDGQYLLYLRGDHGEPNHWFESDALVYYLNAASPLYVLAVFIYSLIRLFIKYYKEDEEKFDK